MTVKRRAGIAIALVFASLLAVMAPAGAKTPAKGPAPAHQTLKTIAASVAQAKTRDAKALAKATAPGSALADAQSALTQATLTVTYAQALLNAEVSGGNAGQIWGATLVRNQAVTAQTAAQLVVTDLTPVTPPPPPPTTTTTTAPVTTTTQPVTTTTTTQPNAPPTSQVLGLYVGSVQSATSLAKTLGLNPLKAYSYYCDGDSWGTIASCSPATGLPAGTTQLVGVNLTPSKTGLTQVAANVSTFTTLAKHFVGTPVVFRVGWEFDGSWMPWGTGANGNTAAQFAPASALAINALKAGDPQAQFDFSDNTGTSTLAQLKVYMGNNASLWTYVGGDHYDNQGSTTGGQISAMAATVTLASQLNKPLSIGEWGLNGSDDVKFIAGMCQAITHPAQASAANNWPSYTVGPTSYFSADLSINSDISQFPNSINAYKADCAPAN